MNWVKSLIIAFSMYSKIPMPHLNLEEKDMRYVMGFFPLVGLVLGACQFIWYKLSVFLGVPNVSLGIDFSGTAGDCYRRDSCGRLYGYQ